MVDMIAMFWPGGAVWSPILHAFYDGIGSYAWTIVVVMLILKLLLTPLDFWQRRITSKNAGAQEKMKPDLDNLKKQHAANMQKARDDSQRAKYKQIYSQSQMSIYKKHNFSLIGSCLGMFVNLALTMTIFISLYTVMSGIATENLKNQYPAIRDAYYQTFDETYYQSINNSYYQSLSLDPAAQPYLFEDPENRTSEYTEQAFADAGITETLESAKTQADTSATEQALKIVKQTYNENNESFLWVKSLWRSDTSASAVPSFDEYFSIAGIQYEDKDGVTAEQQKEADRAEYDKIMGGLIEDMGNNGYYGLIIITVLVTALSQFLLWLTMRQKKTEKTAPKHLNPNLPGAGKPMPKIPPNLIMMIILPIIMLFFTLTANAAFAIYLITTYLVSSATIPITTLISRKIDAKKKKAEEEAVEVSYRRK